MDTRSQRTNQGLVDEDLAVGADAPPTVVLVDRRRRLLQLGVAGLPIALFSVGIWSHRWMAEDGFINLRIVDQILAGNGPVFNDGFRVEVATSPLWLWLLVVLRLLLGWAVRAEWLAVGAGLVLSVGGLVGATYGAWTITTASTRAVAGDRPRFFLPAGTLVVAALPPFWDFATSGLENGLVFGWLGTTFALVARRRRALLTAAPRSPARPWPLLVLVGLGPVIRPELALLTVAFGGAVWLLSAPGWRARTASAAIALALPVGYQLFRMGYYGALVPSTAIAKEAGMSQWGQGVAYLGDLVRPYQLVLPLVLLTAVGVSTARSWDRPSLVVACAPVLGGALYAVYVLRVGGDYMHGRLWLAPLFALVLPVAVVPVPAHGLGRAVTAIASLGLAGWAVVCAAGLRPPYSGNLMPFDATTQIQDERAFELRHADGTSNPVAADDFPKLAQVGREMRARAEAGEDVFVTFAPGWQDQTPLAAGRGTWVAEPMAGIMPAVAGPRVSIFDYYGIVDPIAARVRVEGDPTRPLRPGHLKSLDAAWGVAVATWPDTVPGDRASQLAHCRPIDELMHAVRDPMTPSRFAQNVLAAPRLTSLRFPADPNEAARELCPSGEREGPEPDRSAVTSPAPTVPRLSPSTCIDVTLALADLSDPEPSAAVERSAAQLRDRLPEDLRADVDEAVRARGVDEARRETSIARITSWVNAAC